MPARPYRKRMKRREVPGGVRFATFSCERRIALLGNARIRDLFADRLAAMRDLFKCELFAWVVMPEHVHLIVRPRGGKLEQSLEYLKKSVARVVISRWREIDAPILKRIIRPDGSVRYWQKGGGFDRNIRDEGEFAREVHYIHHNLVKRGLAASPGDWAWSSARWWLGERQTLVACDEPDWVPDRFRAKHV